MREGTVIARLFLMKKGSMAEIAIRAPEKSDLDSLMKFYNKVIKETDFLSACRPVSRKSEAKWLRTAIDDMKNKRSIHLFAESGGKIVGSCSVSKKIGDRSGHVGAFGICILQEYTGCGLGTKMTQAVLDAARKDLKIRIAELSVYSNNKIAQNLYKKIGFVHAGKIPKAIRQGRKFVDNIIMYKVLE